MDRNPYGRTPVEPVPEDEMPDWVKATRVTPPPTQAPAHPYLTDEASRPAQPTVQEYLAQRSAAPAPGVVVPAPGAAYPAPAGYPAPLLPGVRDPLAKSRVVAGLLGIFLGAFGIHRFYLGHTSVGLTMLLMTLLSFGFLGFVTGLWGFIEGILCLTDRTGSYSRDATGRPLR